MEYYLISLIISIIVFSLIQYYEYNRISNENQNENSNENYQTYSLFTTSNYLLFGIIYLLITIISYYLYSSNLKIMNLFTSKKNNINDNIINNNIHNNIHNNEITIKDDINPEVISKIQDNFDTGLDPFNSDYDSDTTISSISSKK